MCIWNILWVGLTGSKMVYKTGLLHISVCKVDPKENPEKPKVIPEWTQSMIFFYKKQTPSQSQVNPKSKPGVF